MKNWKKKIEFNIDVINKYNINQHNRNQTNRIFLKMVKNVTGGSKHKSQGRKFVNNSSSKQHAGLRVIEEEGEIYSQVTKMLGNGMCHVISVDNKTRLCFIRGKFRGRGKRDNTIKVGSWILIGLRDWESGNSAKDLEKCDLLEVYSDIDKERLKKTVNCNWSNFIENDSIFSNTKANDGIIFEDDITEEYKTLMENEITNNDQTKKILGFKSAMESVKESLSEDEINIDDI